MPLYVTEYSRLAEDNYGDSIMAGQEPARGTQVIAIGGASVQSQPFTDTTRFVRLHTDAPCLVLFGSNPTAGPATSMRLGAGATEYLGVSPGLRVAVIQTT